MYFYQTGRERHLSIAEIESLTTSEVVIINNQFVASNDKLALFSVGGVIKACEQVATFPTQDIKKIKQQLVRLNPHTLIRGKSNSKYNLGISAYGVSTDVKQLTGIGLELKKTYKQLPHPIRLRIVPNKELQLSNAQVLHNQLHNVETGVEIVLIAEKNSTHIALTYDTQDLDAYSARDHARPVRDTYVGMLPPKLAQVMINIATKGKQADKTFLLDPFCGTGVVLQEALRSGFNAYGSDISPNMVSASKENLKWFTQTEKNEYDFVVELGDATQHQWSKPVSAVVSEIYLGQPLTEEPTPQKLEQLSSEANTLTENFLKNLAPQIKLGTSICLAVPTWRTRHSFSQSLSVDHLKKLGYTSRSFKYVDEELIYIRKNQITGRRLLVLNKD